MKSSAEAHSIDLNASLQSALVFATKKKNSEYTCGNGTGRQLRSLGEVGNRSGIGT
jgi:hypothetical protein